MRPKFLTIPRPTKWTFLRVTLLGMIGSWIIPAPWHDAEPQEPPLPVATLAPAALEWCATQPRVRVDICNFEK